MSTKLDKICNFCSAERALRQLKRLCLADNKVAAKVEKDAGNGNGIGIDNGNSHVHEAHEDAVDIDANADFDVRETSCDILDSIYGSMSVPRPSFFRSRSYTFHKANGIRIILDLLNRQGECRHVTLSIFQLLVLLIDLDMTEERKRSNRISTDLFQGQSPRRGRDRSGLAFRAFTGSGMDSSSSTTNTAMSIELSGQSHIITKIYDLHKEDDADIRNAGRIIIRAIIQARADASIVKMEWIGKALELGLSFRIFEQVQELTHRMTHTETKKESYKDSVTYPDKTGEGASINDNEESEASMGTATHTDSSGSRNEEMQIFVEEMTKHPDNYDVQHLGLKIILKYLQRRQAQNTETDSSSILNMQSLPSLTGESFAILLKSAIMTKTQHEEISEGKPSTEQQQQQQKQQRRNGLLRLAFSILLHVSTSAEFCVSFSKQSGGEQIIKWLFQLIPPVTVEGVVAVKVKTPSTATVTANRGEKQFLQLALWCLSNLTQENVCRMHLEKAGLMPYLFDLISIVDGVGDNRVMDAGDEDGDEDATSKNEMTIIPNLFVPLPLRLLYKMEELKNSKIFYKPETKDVDDNKSLGHEEKNEDGSIYSPTAADTLRHDGIIGSNESIRRPQFKSNPSYGTTSGMFQHGEPGLI